MLGDLRKSGTLKGLEGLIQGFQRIDAGITHPAGRKFIDPARRDDAVGRFGDLLSGRMTGFHPLTQDLNMLLDVHNPKPSTGVLGKQHQKIRHLLHAQIMDNKTRKIVAHNIKRLRISKNWNQTELGKRAGVGQTTVSSIENPDGKSPTLEILAALAKAFDVPEWTLLVDGSCLDAQQLRTLDHLIHTYADLPESGKSQVQRVAEAEERYAKAG